jgi:hypothetical protein
MLIYRRDVRGVGARIWGEARTALSMFHETRFEAIWDFFAFQRPLAMQPYSRI